MVFVFATGTMVNANSSTEKIDEGRGCVDSAMNIVMSEAAADRWDTSSGSIYYPYLMNRYKKLYGACMGVYE